MCIHVCTWNKTYMWDQRTSCYTHFCPFTTWILRSNSWSDFTAKALHAESSHQHTGSGTFSMDIHWEVWWVVKYLCLKFKEEIIFEASEGVVLFTNKLLKENWGQSGIIIALSTLSLFLFCLFSTSWPQRKRDIISFNFMLHKLGFTQKPYLIEWKQYRKNFLGTYELYKQ